MIIDHDDNSTNTSDCDKDNDSNACAGGEVDEDIAFRLEGNQVVGLRSSSLWPTLRRSPLTISPLYLANPLSLAMFD